MKLKMIGILLVAGLPSCVSYTNTKGESATAKRFQNVEATQLFYETEFVKKPYVEERDNRVLAIGVKLPVSWHTRVSDQKRVNNAFRTADLNQNGVLSLSEAREFAESKHKSAHEIIK